MTYKIDKNVPMPGIWGGKRSPVRIAIEDLARADIGDSVFIGGVTRNQIGGFLGKAGAPG